MLSWTQNRLTPEQRDFLAGLPDRHTEEGVTLAHGSLRPSLELVEYVLGIDDALGSFAHLGTELGFVGHSHRQAGFESSGDRVREISVTAVPIRLEPGARYLINPGSVGLPRDGRVSAAYAWIDLEARELVYARAEYEAAPVVREIRRLGFDEFCPSAIMAST
jgi:diadenosine tetraphosphatase ApaH/serine/threonine PP2A family protein phosphatase